MTIKSINEFQIKTTTELPDEEPRVLLENTKSNKQVELLGRVLKAQYCVGDNFLILFTQVLFTQDYPYEESLYIHYLNHDLQLLDSLHLEAIYSAGIKADLAIVSLDKIQFSFFGYERWTLQVLSSPKYLFSSNRYPVKRRRSIFRKNWLSLKAEGLWQIDSLQSINEFQIKTTTELPDEEPRVLLENTKSNKQVELLGKTFEAQYRIGDNFLILFTLDCPFEESLYIYYLNHDLQLLDSLYLGAIYAAGIVTDLAIVNPDKIQFSFFGDERWTLQVLSSPKYLFSSNRYPVRRERCIFRKNWLSLKAEGL